MTATYGIAGVFVKKFHKVLLIAIYLAADLAALTAGCLSALWVASPTDAVLRGEMLARTLDAYNVFICALIGVWILLCLKSLYIVIERNRGRYEELNETGADAARFIALVLICRLFFNDSNFPKTICTLFCIFFPLWLLAARFVASRLRHYIYSCDVMRSRILLIGSRYVNQLLIKRINILSSGYYFDIIGMVEDDFVESQETSGIRYLGSLSILPEVLNQGNINAVYVTNPTLGRKELFGVLELCEERNIELHVVTNVFDIIISKKDLFEMSGITTIRANENITTGFFLFIKRLFDIVMSAAMLLALAPVFLLVACVIRADSCGPILFTQIRMGMDRKSFRMLKFRTMLTAPEKSLKESLGGNDSQGPVFKLAKNDPRITGVGGILRKYSLDELPQLLNILRGEMSFVGPRPEESRVVDRYNIYERRRLKVKPGLTGLQQISCRNTRDFDERMFYDLFYVRKRSIFVDAHILVQTFFNIHKGQ